MATTPFSIPNMSRDDADFNQDKYSVSTTMYPDDLLKEPNDYGGNYVVFNININVDSKLAKSNAPGSETVDNVPQRVRSYVTGGDDANNASRSTAAMVASSQAETYLGSFLGGIAINRASDVLHLPGAAASSLVHVIESRAALASGALLSLKGAGSTTNTRAQKRLKTSIALGIPEDLSVSYATSWQDESMTNPLIANKIGNNLKGSFEALVGFGQAGKSIQGSGIGTEASAAFANVGLRAFGGSGFASSATGIAANPMKEQVFKGANMREFTFTYTFYPRTRLESQNVQNIIYLFKYHMLPEFLDKDKFLFVYPSEFDITYYNHEKVNKNLFRHTSCVLKQMDVDYTPNQQFNTFHDGAPIAMKMRLSFMELLPMTKALVEIGA